MNYQILVGDCLSHMRTLEISSVDSIVTDPPYGIRFMGKAWDGDDILAMAADRMKYHGDDAVRAGVRGGHKSMAAQAGKYDLRPSANKAFQDWTEAWAIEALRILKPGGHLLCFASTRTYHRMATGIEDAGFEIRDQIGWCFGSGFPKSHNLHGDWEGWGTALKPAWEPICVARKPFKGTVAENVLRHGTGAINIAGCRIEGEPVPLNRTEQLTGFGQEQRPDYEQVINVEGRWPANIIHDGSDEILAAFPDAPGQQGDLQGQSKDRLSKGIYGDMPAARFHKARRDGEPSANRRYTEEGSTNFAATPGERRFGGGNAARFFYCAKASREDRNEGCYAFVAKPLLWSSGEQSPGTFQAAETNRSSENNHPTVKPTDLMRWLCRLVTPSGGTVSDPFMGSGSTGKAALLEGFNFIGIEREEDYCAIAKARLEHVLETHEPLFKAFA